MKILQFTISALNIMIWTGVETYLSDPSGDAPLMVDRITSALPRISLIDFYTASLTDLYMYMYVHIAYTHMYNVHTSSR